MKHEIGNAYLPVSLNITGKKIMIVGGGKVGLHKAGILSRFTKEATVVSPRFEAGFADLPFTLVQKEYTASDLNGVDILFICTENEALNARIKSDAEARRILASVCDNPRLCDFISPAIFTDSEMSIAVSSAATDVRRSIRVRDKIKALVASDRSLIE